MELHVSKPWRETLTWNLCGYNWNSILVYFINRAARGISRFDRKRPWITFFFPPNGINISRGPNPPNKVWYFDLIPPWVDPEKVLHKRPNQELIILKLPKNLPETFILKINCYRVDKKIVVVLYGSLTIWWDSPNIKNYHTNSIYFGLSIFKSTD